MRFCVENKAQPLPRIRMIEVQFASGIARRWVCVKYLLNLRLQSSSTFFVLADKRNSQGRLFHQSHPPQRCGNRATRMPRILSWATIVGYLAHDFAFQYPLRSQVQRDGAVSPPTELSPGRRKTTHLHIAFLHTHI